MSTDILKNLTALITEIVNVFILLLSFTQALSSYAKKVFISQGHQILVAPYLKIEVRNLL